MDNENNIFLVGKEWIYFKIYTGEYIADKLLEEFIILYRELFNEKIVDKWFFIRYYDPKFHLRLRFHLPDSSLFNKVVMSVNSRFSRYLENGLIEKIQIDTYIRETERYGGPVGICLSENIFFSDSVMTCNLLMRLDQENQKEKFRWIFGLVSINRMLDDFNFSLEMKLALMDTLMKYFVIDAVKDKYLNKQIDVKFKEHLKELNEVLVQNKIDYFENLIANRSQMYHSSILGIMKNIEEGVINKDIRDLLSSYIHMCCNRLFRIESRRHEYILYNLLLRFYKQKFYAG